MGRRMRRKIGIRNKKTKLENHAAVFSQQKQKKKMAFYTHLPPFTSILPKSQTQLHDTTQRHSLSPFFQLTSFYALFFCLIVLWNCGGCGTKDFGRTKKGKKVLQE